MKRLGIRFLLAALVMCLLLCNAAYAETYASLVDKLGNGMTLCSECGTEAPFTSDENFHCVVCPNEACMAYNSEWNTRHSSSCVDGSVCGVCGAAWSNYAEHVSYGMPYETSEQYHWQYCALCGRKVNESIHDRNCTEEDCQVCGYASNDHFIVYHSPDGVNLSDAEYHWQNCQACGGEAFRNPHFAYCDALDACAVCGAAYSGSNVYHHYDYNSDLVPLPSNSELHGRLCSSCGEEENYGEHSAKCDELGVCFECGVEYTGSNRLHTGIDYSASIIPLPSNPDYHGYVCASCGGEENHGEHYADCTEPGVCGGCGAAYSGSSVNHNYDYSSDLVPLPSDPEYHGRLCLDCGAENSYGTHYAYCNEPDVCCECGAAYSGSDVYHNYDYSSDLVPLPSDPEYHGRLCLYCGAEENYGTHYAYCNEPDVCGGCGAAYSGSNLRHTNLDYSAGLVQLPSDPERHGYICLHCGGEEIYGWHYANCDAPDTCARCGAAAACELIHELDYDNYVQNPEDLDYHGYACVKCDYVSIEDWHYAYCTYPNVCYVCHAEGEMEMRHNGIDYDAAPIPLPSNPDRHGYICASCGGEEDRGRHYAVCNDPDVCLGCGIEYDCTDIDHTIDWENVQSDNTRHWYLCVYCGEVCNKSRHRADCGDPTTCYNCGAEGVEARLDHDYDYGNYQSDENHHWALCAVCGEPDEKDRHSADCTDPTTCYDCGAEGVAGARLGHNYDAEELQSNAKYHWDICEDCGEIVGKGVHWTDCSDPTTCYECGAEDVYTEVAHYYHYSNLQYDGKYHWDVCYVCGEIVEKGMHWAVCTDPTTCYECGAQCSPEELEHDYYYSDWHGDANEHWHICEDCGVVTGRSEHAASCTEPGVCEDCGAQYEGGNVEHNNEWEDQECDESGHWYVCYDCGAEINKDTHWAHCDMPGVCVDCGYEDVNLEGRHYYSSSNTHLLQCDEVYHWYLCEGCGEETDRSSHFDEYAPAGSCDLCGAAMDGAAPVIYAQDVTLYMTEKGYGDVREVLAHNADSAEPGELSAASSDPSVMTAEAVWSSENGNTRFRITGLKTGTATLTITAPNGLSSSITVTVRDAQNEIVLPSGTKTIADEAFAGMSDAELIYIPSGATAIGERAFADCKNLKVIYIPASVETIGEDAFAGCEELLICTPEGSAAQTYAFYAPIEYVND